MEEGWAHSSTFKAVKRIEHAIWSVLRSPEVSRFFHAERYADWQSQRAALMMLIHVAPTCEVMRQGVERFYRHILSMLSCLPASYAVHQERLHNLRKMLVQLGASFLRV
jgi:hypothetical protein